MIDSELLLKDFPIARQKILADFRDYMRRKMRFACKHYYDHSCPLDDECSCDSGDNKDGYVCNKFESAEFKSYFEIMDYDESELAEMEEK